MTIKPVVSRTDANVSVEPVSLQFSLHGLRTLLVYSNIMVFVVGSSVYKIDLNKPSVVHHYDIEVKGKPEKIVRTWMDWEGSQVVVRTAQGHYFYLHESYEKFKHLGRFKGLEIQDIAFKRQKDSSGSKQREWLLGTKDGSIYIAHVQHHDPPQYDSKRDDKYIKIIYSGKGKNCTLSHISYIDDGVVAVIDGQLLRWQVRATTYADMVKEMKTLNFKSSVDNGDSTSKLFYSDGFHFVYSNYKQVITNDPEYFIENFDPTVCQIVKTQHHTLALTSCGSITIIPNLAPSRSFSMNIPNVDGIIADVVAHTYWLFSPSSIYEVVVSKEKEAVWYDYFSMDKYEKALKCLSEYPRDFRTSLVLTKQGYSYLQKGNFGIDYEEIEPSLLENQIKGIKILGESDEPFEKVCLMLISLPNKGISEQLLIEYLLVKLRMAKAAHNKIRIVALSSWIVETMLRLIYRSDKNKAANADDQFHKFLEANYKILDAPTVYQIIKGYNYPSKLIYYAELIGDFEFILDYYIDKENWSEALKVLIKIYTLGPEKRDIIYAKSTHLLINAPEKTVNTWLKLSELDYDRLLPAIASYNKNNNNIPLIHNQAVRFFSTIIYEKEVRNINVNNYFLILLISYPHEKEESSKLILKLLAKLEGSRHQYDANFILRQCLSYEKYHAAITILINDMQMFENALQLAIENDFPDLANFVLRKYDDYLFGRESQDDYMMNLSVDVDNEDARKFVGKIKIEEESFSSRKKLWLMFAKYLIEGVCSGKDFEFINDTQDRQVGETETNQGKKDDRNIAKNLINSMTNNEQVDSHKFNQFDSSKIGKILKYLLNASYDEKVSSNVLSLKDLLPLFPEQVMVNNFKDEIIHSLNQYNNKIVQLSFEMEESLTISQKLKQQIQESQEFSFKGSVYSIVEPGEPCQLCGLLLVNRGFMCFPNCQHSFHKECLIKHYLKSRGEYKFKKIFQSFKNGSTEINKRELDDLLRKECVLCNENNINNIDENLIDEKECKADIAKWEL